MCLCDVFWGYFFASLQVFLFPSWFYSCPGPGLLSDRQWEVDANPVPCAHGVDQALIFASVIINAFLHLLKPLPLSH